MSRRQKLVRKLYQSLLTLYPRAFQERFGASMVQTFDDLCHERQCHERQRQTAERLYGFVFWVFFETVVGIVKEHTLRMKEGDVMKAIISNPKPAALISLLLTLPFILLNTIAINSIEPFFTIFKINTGGGFWDHPIGHSTALVALLPLPCGALISIRPMLQASGARKREFYLMNILLSVILLTASVLITGALLEEIYRCNVLQIPNCD